MVFTTSAEVTSSFSHKTAACLGILNTFSSQEANGPPSVESSNVPSTAASVKSLEKVNGLVIVPIANCASCPVVALAAELIIPEIMPCPMYSFSSSLKLAISSPSHSL